MKYLDKKIEKIVKTKNRAKSDLIDAQNAMASFIQSHSKFEPKFPMIKSDFDRYSRDLNELYSLIEKCEIVLAELIILKEMNQDQ